MIVNDAGRAGLFHTTEERRQFLAALDPRRNALAFWDDTPSPSRWGWMDKFDDAYPTKTEDIR